MTGHRRLFAALAAIFRKAFTTHRNREESIHWITLFPATARATIQRPGHRQGEDAAPLRQRPVDRN